MWVKICGITRLEDALCAAELGADAVGFIFAESPRRVTPECARRIAGSVPRGVTKVGVFADSPLEDVLDVVERCGLDMVQLHGSESPEYCSALGGMVIRTVRLEDVPAVGAVTGHGCSLVLLEAPKTGRRAGPGDGFDWRAARPFAAARRTLIAGGLAPENVAEAVRLAQPFGVDVASGVERAPRKKDHALMRRFVEEARNAGMEACR